MRPALRGIAGAFLAGGLIGLPAASSHASPQGFAHPFAQQLAVAALGALGAPNWLLESIAEGDDPPRVFPALAPAGDLDDDGADDLVSLTREGEDLARTLVMTARRGADGTELFRTDTGLPGAVVLRAGEPVGPGRGRRGAAGGLRPPARHR